MSSYGGAFSRKGSTLVPLHQDDISKRSPSGDPVRVLQLSCFSTVGLLYLLHRSVRVCGRSVFQCKLFFPAAVVSVEKRFAHPFHLRMIFQTPLVGHCGRSWCHLSDNSAIAIYREHERRSLLLRRRRRRCHRPSVTRQNSSYCCLTSIVFLSFPLFFLWLSSGRNWIAYWHFQSKPRNSNAKRAKRTRTPPLPLPFRRLRRHLRRQRRRRCHRPSVSPRLPLRHRLDVVNVRVVFFCGSVARVLRLYVLFFLVKELNFVDTVHGRS